LREGLKEEMGMDWWWWRLLPAWPDLGRNKQWCPTRAAATATAALVPHPDLLDLLERRDDVGHAP
jgi:hypothetical protein